MSKIRYEVKYGAGDASPSLEDMLAAARRNGKLAASSASEPQQVSVLVAPDSVTIVKHDGQAPAPSAPSFEAAFNALMRGQSVASPRTPDPKSFEQAATRLLRAPGRPLPAPWRVAEKAAAALSETPHLLRYQLGRWG